LLAGVYQGTVIFGNVLCTGAQAGDTSALLGRYLDWLIGTCAPLWLHVINQGAATTSKQLLGLASLYVDLNLDFPTLTQQTLAQHLAQTRTQKASVESAREQEETRLATVLEALAEHAPVSVAENHDPHACQEAQQVEAVVMAGAVTRVGRGETYKEP
jgi:hypothetical protein